ncbi:MAG TPA: hypothetical protein GXX69_00470 [Firmicutes bacterium]|nr:hypothetical protein [Bacillota bacterium]
MSNLSCLKGEICAYDIMSTNKVSACPITAETDKRLMSDEREQRTLLKAEKKGQRQPMTLMVIQPKNLSLGLNTENY